MNPNRLYFILMLFIATSCQNEQTPENITKVFISEIAEANCKEALKHTIDEAKEKLEKSIKNGCSTFHSTIKDIKC